MSRPCATTRLTMYRPPIACHRASWSVPMPRSRGGSLAISATRTTTPYPQSRPRTSPTPVSQPPSPLTAGALCHHSATTATAPSPMTVRTPRPVTRPYSFLSRTDDGSPRTRREGLAGYAPAPARRAGSDRLVTVVTIPSLQTFRARHLTAWSCLVVINCPAPAWARTLSPLVTGTSRGLARFTRPCKRIVIAELSTQVDTSGFVNLD